MPPISSTNDTDGPPNPPRLCHMVLTPDFKGYGFNLHTTKERPGQYIGQVDDNSPAHFAKLKKKDRIVEVNGVNISNENHKQVVARIKAVDNETRLLVVDDSCDNWYKSNNIVISSSMASVEHCSSVKRRDSDGSSDHKGAPSEDRRSIVSGGSGSSANSDASRQKEKEEDSDAESENAKKSDSESDEEETTEETEVRKESIVSSTKSEDDKEASDDEEDESEDEKDDSVKETENSDKEDESSDEEEKEDSVKEKDVSSDEEDAKSEVVEVVKITESVVEADRKSTTDSEKSGSIHLASEKDDKSQVDSGNAVERKESTSSASSRGSGANTGSTERAVEDKAPSSVSPSPPSSFGSPSPTPQQAPPTKSFNIPGLNMNMSVAEMRAHLASKKKKDIRKEDIDMRKKYDMIQKL